jgi:hypothetical protein
MCLLPSQQATGAWSSLQAQGKGQRVQRPAILVLILVLFWFFLGFQITTLSLLARSHGLWQPEALAPFSTKSNHFNVLKSKQGDLDTLEMFK